MDSASKPFSIKRVVQWGDCDPAGIIYSPRVFDYAVEAVEAWNRQVLGLSWTELNSEMGMGAPMVRAECDYLHPPQPDQEVELAVLIERLGHSSLTYLVRGFGGGRDYFQVRLVTCFVARPEFKSAEIPRRLRQRIAAYGDALDDSPA